MQWLRWLRTSDQYLLGYTIDRSSFIEDDLLIGCPGGDTIIGSKGNNYIYGNGGHDTFVPGAGNNVIDAGLPFSRIGIGSTSIGVVAAPRERHCIRERDSANDHGGSISR